MKGREPKATAHEQKEESITIEAFTCPITLETFKEPVIAADGHTYEKKEILKWLESHDTSPKTGQKLTSKLVMNNFALKDSMEETSARLNKQEQALKQLKDRLQEERASRWSWWDLCFFGQQTPVDEKDQKMLKRRSCF